MSHRGLQGEIVAGDSRRFTLGDELGDGAEGSVYTIKGSDSTVVKVFVEDIRERKAAKIQAMIANEPVDPTHQKHGIHSIVWPLEAVTDPDMGAFLGYTMPYQDLDQHKEVQRYASEELLWETSEENERFRIAYNLAIAVYAIHEQGHALGDLNHQNILIDDGFISLIDCDGFHINGENDTYPTKTWFPRYTPPSGPGDTLEEVQENDRFGLGVHIFQILMEGFHPYQAQGDNIESGGFHDWIKHHPFAYENPQPGIQPHDYAPKYNQLPQGIRDLFVKCFETQTEDHTGDRILKHEPPTAEEWYKTLDQFVEDDIRAPSDVFNTGTATSSGSNTRSASSSGDSTSTSTGSGSGTGSTQSNATTGSNSTNDSDIGDPDERFGTTDSDTETDNEDTTGSNSTNGSEITDTGDMFGNSESDTDSAGDDS